MSKNREKAVPRGRISRFGRVARMAGGIAAGMIGEGARQLSQGNRPKMTDMLITPGNAKRLAEQLATMRGAAMKVGQLLSMETSDFLPPELAEILSQLRNQAYSMPSEQLESCLIDAYGQDWKSRFQYFDRRPMAAASIGQVHRATTHEGDEIVLKIQYPGVSESIDSDVDNIASLLRITNLIPKQIEIDQLLSDAKVQLHEEADYIREAKYLEQFEAALTDHHRFVTPRYFKKLSTVRILAMSFLQGEPIERLQHADVTDRDAMMTDLVELMLRELFELRLMQTDGNFANYLYQSSEQKIALLDFGATRSFSKKFVIDYKRLLRAVSNDDADSIVDAADRLGYVAHNASDEYREFLIEVFRVALEPFAHQGQYDFKTARLSDRLAQSGEAGYDMKEFWQAPPADVIYLHRKIGGIYLLATRLEARVNVHELAAPYLEKLALD